MPDETNITKRRVELGGHARKGWFAEVVLTDYEEVHGHLMPDMERRVSQFAFTRLDRDTAADRVRGDLEQFDGPVAVWSGATFDSGPIHVLDPDDPGDRQRIPEDVEQALLDSNITLLKGVETGWAEWDGRPEWSDTYLDVTNAEVVELKGTGKED